MLFPDLGPQYLNEEDRGILQKMEKFYNDSITINQTYWGEADTDNRFMAGDQTLWNEIYGNMPAHQRKDFSFNRIRRIVNMVSGYQRKNRKSTVVIPVENADEETADQFTKIFYWINNQEQILNTISEAFHGSLVSGMNLLHVWMDYRSDPISGNIKVDNCSYNSFLIDPYFKKADLSDCNAIWKRSYLTKRECISLLPAHEEEIISLPPFEGTRDGKFNYMPQTFNYSQNNLLTYDEYYYRDYRTQRMLVDTQTGETMEWTSNDEDKLQEFLSFYPQVTLVDQEIPSVKVAIVVQGKVMYDGPNPMGIDCYPFVPVFAYYSPELSYFPYRVQGMVRGLRDSQYLYNRRRIIELDILESQINSGWLMKENALVNPEDAFMNGQGRVLALKQEANLQDVQQIPPPQVPPSMIQLSQLLGQEIQEISGVNEELLGSAVDDKAGILSMLRQGAGLTTLQGLFDQLDNSQKLLGEIILKLVQTNFTPGKVKKILNGKEPAPQFYNKAFGRYGAAIEEGLNTTTQKQMQFAQLLHLREIGLPIPDNVLVDSATLQNKKELKEALMQASQQQQQVQQVQLQSQIQEQQARTNLANARAVADKGLGMERISRIQENQALVGERKAEAEKDRQLALLHMAEALKELEEVDLRQLEKLISLSKMVKEMESPQSFQNGSEGLDRGNV